MPDLESLRQTLITHGQEHVLRWRDELDEAEWTRLLCQFAGIDFAELAALWKSAQQNEPLGPIRPAPVRRLPGSFDEWESDQKLAERGEAALKAGHVGILLVAGGLGTRLGFPGPKGTFPIGPVSQRSLFQIHAEKVLALSRRHEQSLPLYIMTSVDNDADTRAFFDQHGNFGLDRSQVAFFVQDEMPAVNAATGKLLMSAKSRVATSPNGHGGIVQALAKSGLLADMTRRGIRQLFYFQVDNPLVKIADASFLGFHLESNAEMSLKVLEKLGPLEKVGNLVQVDDRLRIIEYSDMSKDLAEKRTTGGELEIWAGSIAIHIFDVAFLERLAAAPSLLPFHRAIKKVAYLDDNGNMVEPAQENAMKFEKFIFDALPLARNAVAVETSRAEEFEPLKEAKGANSPATVRSAMSNLYAKWLENAGVLVRRDAEGNAAVPLEISPLFAMDDAELRGKIRSTDPVTEPLVLAEGSAWGRNERSPVTDESE